MVIYLGARLELRSLAARQVERFAARTPGAEKWSVSPDFLNPMVWDGIVQSHKQIERVRIQPLDGVITEIIRMERPSPSQIPQQALDTETASTLLAFARFPIIRFQKAPSGYRVLIFDFRFYSDATNTALASEILLDPSFRITKESLSFQKPLE